MDFAKHKTKSNTLQVLYVCLEYKLLLQDRAVRAYDTTHLCGPSLPSIPAASLLSSTAYTNAHIHVQKLSIHHINQTKLS